MGQKRIKTKSDTKNRYQAKKDIDKKNFYRSFFADGKYMRKAPLTSRKDVNVWDLSSKKTENDKQQAVSV